MIIYALKILRSAVDATSPSHISLIFFRTKKSLSSIKFKLVTELSYGKNIGASRGISMSYRETENKTSFMSFKKKILEFLLTNSKRTENIFGLQHCLRKNTLDLCILISFYKEMLKEKGK